MVNLEELTRQLDPDTINEKVGDKHKQAREGYKLKSFKVANYEDFRNQVIKYVQHHYKSVHGHELTDETAWQRAKELLVNDEGRPDIIGHYKLAKKGNLDKVIDKIRDVAELKETTAYADHVFDAIDPLDHEQQTALAKQYLDIYGKFLPAELKAKKPEHLAKDYKQLVNAHVRHVMKQKEDLTYDKD
jgi:hypothetical protein